jgi:hypothetical protein
MDKKKKLGKKKRFKIVNLWYLDKIEIDLHDSK